MKQRCRDHGEIPRSISREGVAGALEEVAIAARRARGISLPGHARSSRHSRRWSLRGSAAAATAARLGARGHPRRARRRRRRCEPLGLHPFEGDDRLRWRTFVRASLKRAWHPRLTAGEPPDLEALRARVRERSHSASRDSMTRQLESQGVRLMRGRHRQLHRQPHHHDRAVSPGTPNRSEEVAEPYGCRGRRRNDPRHRLGAAGARPWAPVDGERVLITRQAYPPRVIPRSSDRDRLRRDRGRVRTHVPLVRLRGDTRRLAPAGSADEGSRGRRRPRRRLREARCTAHKGRAGKRRRHR
jgi:hypothetical protein